MAESIKKIPVDYVEAPHFCEHADACSRIDGLISHISEEELIDLAELFRVFGDSTRIKILYVLFQGEKNVTEICTELEMNQSAVSHQLKILKTNKLIRSRRAGKSICYSLADDHVKTIIAMGKEHIEE